MLQIEQTNPLLEKTVRERIAVSDEPLRSVDRIVSDFDFTTFHVTTPQDSKTSLIISLYVKCWDDLAGYGAVDYLQQKYGGYDEIAIAPEPEQGYNYTLAVDTEALQAKDEEYQNQVVADIGLLKRHAMAVPFAKAFARYDELAQQHANSDVYAEDVREALRSEPVLVIRYRGTDECIYIKPSFDRVTVIFSTVFQDETDKIFGRVFLQEFVDARKRSVQNAPQVLYSHRDAPSDIASVQHGATNNDKKGYVTLVLFPRHLMPQKRENCITHVQVFRNYFHYHIKCFKAYMHSRMRTRVKDFLKVLNRAKPEAVEEEKHRKTASGRRFEQRV
ncbi:actin-related protein 2/3 complex subunit 2 [Diutina catenulata]